MQMTAIGGGGVVVLLAFALQFASAYVPSWEPTYNTQRSTFFMPCNYSGYYDADFASQWGIADFDWSNARIEWANNDNGKSPMNCQERLAEQAGMVRAKSDQVKVFVYRNLVKALPWFRSVREKLMDPAYSGWFLPFKKGGKYHVPNCIQGQGCSDRYFDQEQTPQNYDLCRGVCNCGAGLPCGEYLFDHRNASLRSWLVEEFILGPDALGNRNISGLFFDDEWNNVTQPRQDWMPAEGYCDTHSPVGGPSEEDAYCADDMGLTQADTTALSDAWRETMRVVDKVVLKRGAFHFQMFKTFAGAPKQGAECRAWFARACEPDAPQYADAYLYLYTGTKGGSSDPPTQFDVDLAWFLLSRGDHSYLGYTWSGCQRGAERPPFIFPPALKRDYGVPQARCVEDPARPGVFVRKWTRATIELDCNTYTPRITMRGADDAEEEQHEQEQQE